MTGDCASLEQYAEVATEDNDQYRNHHRCKATEHCRSNYQDTTPHSLHLPSMNEWSPARLRTTD